MNYDSFIQNARLIDEIESNTSTGDLEYKGTALEVCDKDGKELFHVVVDDKGRSQFLFFASKEHYRMPTELLEKIIAAARQLVKKEN